MNCRVRKGCCDLLSSSLLREGKIKLNIGILLCADKNDAVVKFSLPENQKQIFASQYQLYLPTEKMSLDEMQKEIENFEQKVEEQRVVCLAQRRDERAVGICEFW